MRIKYDDGFPYYEANTYIAPDAEPDATPLGALAPLPPLANTPGSFPDAVLVRQLTFGDSEDEVSKALIEFENSGDNDSSFQKTRERVGKLLDVIFSQYKKETRAEFKKRLTLNALKRLIDVASGSEPDIEIRVKN